MPKTVIIAESSPAVTKSIADAFVANGYIIQGAFTDGISALRCAKESPPSVITLDLILPKLSGLQLAAEISRLSPPPLIIAISAVTARPRLAQAKEAGVRYYILKPLANEKLTAVLMKQLSSQASNAQAV